MVEEHREYKPRPHLKHGRPATQPLTNFGLEVDNLRRAFDFTVNYLVNTGQIRASDAQQVTRLSRTPGYIVGVKDEARTKLASDLVAGAIKFKPEREGEVEEWKGRFAEAIRMDLETALSQVVGWRLAQVTGLELKELQQLLEDPSVQSYLQELKNWKR